MEVVRVASAEEFLALSEAYRLAESTRTNVMSSVALAVARGERAYDTCFWWVVRDDADQCVGAAFRTVPFPLHIGPMPVAALPHLARAVADEDHSFTRIAGSKGAVTSFLAAYGAGTSPGSHRHFVPRMKSLLYELGELVMPGVTGSYRVATLGDIELVAPWNRDFHEFTGIPIPPDALERDFLVARLNENSLRLWSVSGTPVSMAGHAAPVTTPSGTITRIGPVFTPEELRGRGYGSAVTAALCEELLARNSRVILYADANYPTSNRVYQRLGFRQVDELVEFDEQ
jgi:RimJ/RimL family protein N-acetyltransferase